MFIVYVLIPYCLFQMMPESMQIPLVLVVLEGGMGTLDIVYSALRFKTPVLLVAVSILL